MSLARLQVALSQAGAASRRKAAEIIESGRVEVNGRAVREKGYRVDTGKDRITLDGRTIFSGGEKHCYYILNKPRGVLSTAKDERRRKTVLDYVILKGKRLYPVGRLDKDTTGLIILTNDGDLTYRLTHPKFSIERIYEVTVKGSVDSKSLLRLKKGIMVEGKLAHAHKVLLRGRSAGSSNVIITLLEGRKREVRNMFKTIGHEVLKLKRLSFGPLRLGNLKEGSSRPLKEEEVLKLRSSVGLI